jgi:hypothetical protein
MSKAERDIRRKLRVLKHYEERGNVAKTCPYKCTNSPSFPPQISQNPHSNQILLA